VLEFCDAVDHEIVGQGLKTGRRDRIAEDIMRQVTTASGVTATSLEIRRRSRLSRGGASNGAPEAHRLTVTIRCLVLNLERDQ